ncbi:MULTISPECIES: histidine kinase [Legionella]|uniref:Histidine kinase n=1 Tax=Legionella bononiensis TaxID=2793102 RepID=A0ABS1W7S9_9GAMM|nr:MULTISPECIES: histidine kinase [Legionella]HAU1025090.1 histidine kinase [Legionella pneumophila]MBL7478503.1 histidine kinase [Legionella bononiensis]MBL7525270.1 histidine kinase [Legionella bononiensis]MBL7561460.1 histidine kinase [Legionella bononiensis]MDX1838164.1 histidine kinase [Legionella taurinensis]
MNKKLFHTLERECLIYLSKKEVTQELLRPLINEFLSTQPEHLLLILAKEEQTTEAVSDVIAHQFTDTHDILIHRVIHHLNDLLYETIKPYYFQNKC